MKIGDVTFSQNEKHHLVMESGGFALEFLDSVTLGVTVPTRCSTVRTKESFAENTVFTPGEDTLLAATEIEPGVKICNRFTVSDKSVKMDTWVEAAHKVYDAALTVGRTQMDATGFDEIGGGDAGRFSPSSPVRPPMALRVT